MKVIGLMWKKLSTNCCQIQCMLPKIPSVFIKENKEQVTHTLSYPRKGHKEDCLILNI